MYDYYLPIKLYLFDMCHTHSPKEINEFSPFASRVVLFFFPREVFEAAEVRKMMIDVPFRRPRCWRF